MHPIVRNVLAVLAGLIIGSVANMGIVMLSGSVIPPPSGADVTTIEGLKASIHLFEPKHFLMPFLAHAIGTLVGAAIASYFALNNSLRLSLAVSVFFMLGGLTNILMLPSPLWFSLLDLLVAYLPMGFLGYKIASQLSKR